MMNRPRLEVADVFRGSGPAFLERYGATHSAAQHRVFRAITECRTSALGGHVAECEDCGHRQIAYNSCRNRHCPKCQAAACAQWMDARSSELLPVPYFHVVFTLPETLAPLALQNKRVVYGLLFQAAAETLREVARNPRHLGAEIGFLAVLHTWGQNLMHHPHVHCVVPGGGVSPDGLRWIASRPDFFLPVRVLSRVFRGKFIAFLKRAFRDGQLQFHGQLKGLASAPRFEQLLNRAVRTQWVVYAKPPFSGPQQVLKYLARYTHRVAITNRRLVGYRDGQVTFRWKNYAAGNKWQQMTLDEEEFIRRFLMHILPKGFQRIRHFGFLANRSRQQKLELCRRLLGVETSQEHAPSTATSAEGRDNPCHMLCPACKQGRLVIIETFQPEPGCRKRPYFLARQHSQAWDTS